jgi:hypothetical protein
MLWQRQISSRCSKEIVKPLRSGDKKKAIASMPPLICGSGRARRRVALSTGAEPDARVTGVAGFVRGFLYQKTDHFQSVKIVLTR